MSTAGGDGNSSGSPQIVTIASPMTWIGYSAGGRPALPGGQRRRGRMLLQEPATAAAGKQASERDARVHLGMGYNSAVVVLPQLAEKDVLQLQQLVLYQLPQGPGAASELRQPQRGLPGSLATLMLWSFDRCVLCRAMPCHVCCMHSLCPGAACTPP
jgi:hypothetical protein